MKGFLTGLATGLAVGYLTAPRSGKETRQQLTDTANEKTQGLKEQWNKVSSQVNQLVSDVQSQFGGGKTPPSVFETTPPTTLGEETYAPAVLPDEQPGGTLTDSGLRRESSPITTTSSLSEGL